MTHPTKGLTPFVPYPVQVDILNGLDAGGQQIVNKARQTGISTSVMIQKVRRSMVPGRTTLVISRKEDLAAELLLIAKTAAETCDPPLPVELVVANKLELRWENGSRIVGQSASPQTGRTFAASDVVFDEFAFLPWQDEMWRAVRPTVSRGANIVVVSTPDMEGDRFHGLWLQATAGTSDWHAHQIHWRDCPEYVVNDDWYNANRPDYTAAEWAQEYECEFGHAADAVFRSALIENAVALGEAPYARGPQSVFAIGGDLAGEGRDATVYIVLDVSARPARVVDLYTVDVAPAPVLQSELERLAAEYKCEPWLDRTGIGWGIISNLKCPAIGLAIVGGQSVSGEPRTPNVARTLLINGLVLALEQGQLAIPRVYQELLMGLRSYRWDKRRGRYPDFVDALAIAWWSVTHAVSLSVAAWDPNRPIGDEW